MTNIPSSELQSILSTRLNEVRKEKTELREYVENIESKIKIHRKLLGPTIRETEDDLNAAMEQLERNHATSAQTNAEERAFMREMDKMRQKKKALANYVKIQAELNELRAQMTTARKKLAEKEDSILELDSGLRKVKLADMLGCNGNEVYEETMTVEESKIPRIVGKGGANLRNLEQQHKCSIKIENSGGIIRIMGTAETIGSCFAAVMKIVETAIEEISLSDESCICLFMDKAQRINDIQARYGVRLDISRAKNLCKLTGPTESVIAAKQEIQSLQSIRTDFLVETSHMPFIIGKGGSNITAMEEQHGVSINVNRERNVIEITGLRPDVNNAVTQLKSLIDENKEVEESIQMDRHVLLGCLIGNGGQLIRDINKEYGVRVDTDSSSATKDNGVQTIRIRGTTAKVAGAKNHILKMVQSFIATSIVFHVEDDFLPILFGKGGTGIKALREKYSGSNIDISDSTIHIQSESEEQRNAIKAEIDELIEANYAESVTLDEDSAIQLKSAKGAEIREELQKELGLRLSIDKNNKFARLRGQRENVNRGVALITEFIGGLAVARIQVSEEDYPTILKPGEDSIVRNFQTKYDVEIAANRKDLTLIIRGSPEAVAEAEIGINGFLEGNPIYGAVFVDVDPAALAAVIGKAGVNVKKMEDQYGVKFDVMKNNNKIRIRGAEPDTLIATKKALIEFVDNTRITETIAITTGLSKAEANEVVAITSVLYQVEISCPSLENLKKTPQSDVNNGGEADVTDTKLDVTIRGALHSVKGAKVRLEEHLTGKGTFIIRILETHCPIMERQIYGSLKRLQEKYAVHVQLAPARNDATNLELIMSGHPLNLSTAKPELNKIFSKVLPVNEFEAVDVDVACLRDIGNSLKNSLNGAVEAASSRNSYFCIDREGHQVILFGNHERSDDEVPFITESVRIIMQHVDEWRSLNYSIPIEEFMIPLILGKGGASINALRKEIKASVEINRKALVLEVKASSVEVGKSASDAVKQRVEALRSQYWEIKLERDVVPYLIGKQGATVNRIRNETGANVDIDANSALLKVSGAEDKVAAAKQLVQELIAEEEKNRPISKSLIITPAAIPAIIGAKGATIREIQTNSGVRLDIDRNSHHCEIRGSESACAKAIDLIDDILAKEGFPAVQLKTTVDVKHGEEEETPSDDDIPLEQEEPVMKMLPGAPPEVLQRMQEKTMSKSSMKRLRKKERTAALESSLSNDQVADTIVGSEESKDDYAAAAKRHADFAEAATSGKKEILTLPGHGNVTKTKDDLSSTTNAKGGEENDDLEFADALPAPPTPAVVTQSRPHLMRANSGGSKLGVIGSGIVSTASSDHAEKSPRPGDMKSGIVSNTIDVQYDDTMTADASKRNNAANNKSFESKSAVPPVQSTASNELINLLLGSEGKSGSVVSTQSSLPVPFAPPPLPSTQSSTSSVSSKAISAPPGLGKVGEATHHDKRADSQRVQQSQHQQTQVSQQYGAYDSSQAASVLMGGTFYSTPALEISGQAPEMQYYRPMAPPSMGGMTTQQELSQFMMGNQTQFLQQHAQQFQQQSMQHSIQPMNAGVNGFGDGRTVYTGVHMPMTAPPQLPGAGLPVTGIYMQQDQQQSTLPPPPPGLSFNTHSLSSNAGFAGKSSIAPRVSNESSGIVSASDGASLNAHPLSMRTMNQYDAVASTANSPGVNGGKYYKSKSGFSVRL